MWLYVVAVVAVAVVPLALAGFGAHLATPGIDDPRKRCRAKIFIWGLAVLGVFVFIVLQVITYRSDKAHEAADQARDRDDKSFRADTTAKLQTIIHEPDDAKRKAAANTLSKMLRQSTKTAAPSPTPAPIVPSSPIVPSYGNLKMRCIQLSQDLASFIAYRLERQNENPQPWTLELRTGMSRTTDIEFRMKYLSQVVSLRDELAVFHVKDPQLDKLIKEKQDNSPLRPDEEWIRWVTILDITDFRDRLLALANQIQESQTPQP